MIDQITKPRWEGVMASEKLTTAFIGTLLGAALGITTTYMMGVSSNKTDIAVLATKMEIKIGNLTKHISEAMTDRYRGADAAKDHHAINATLLQIQIKERQLDAKLEAHSEMDRQLAAEFRAHVVYCERDRKE